MPASKTEQVLDALKALLEAMPGATIESNSVLPEKIPDGGLIIMRDGEPGEPGWQSGHGRAVHGRSRCGVHDDRGLV